MHAVEVFELTKIYKPPRGIWRLAVKSPLKEEVKAVDAVNFIVSWGEVFGLIGPNGAGKTTLLKMLATLIWPTSGEAKVANFDIVREEDEVRSRVGFVSGNERSFFWRLSGRENLEFYASLYNLPRKEAKKKIDQLLDLLSLSQVADNMYYSYSSGMRQKLALARALLNSPCVLILDEPTKSVDPKMSAFILSFLREKAAEEGVTVLLASHRLEEVQEYCDRFALMDKGRMIFCGDVNNLKRVVGMEHIYEVKFMGKLSPSFLEKLERLGAREVHLKKVKGQNLNTLTFTVSKDEKIQEILAGLFNKREVLSFARRELNLEKMIQAYQEVVS
jgi:ABC-2 type transport system ATP-binding protein